MRHRKAPCTSIGTAYLRLRERPRRRLLEAQGVTAPHLKESLGKAAVLVGVKVPRNAVGRWETVPFV
eukprot:1296444-Rhodomonas_salina.1